MTILEWFEQAIAEAEANHETSTFIAWLKEGQAVAIAHIDQINETWGYTLQEMGEL